MFFGYYRKFLKYVLSAGILFFCTFPAEAREGKKDRSPSDTLSGIIHRISTEIRPGCIIPTNSFLKGVNLRSKPLRHTASFHLRYSFRSRSGSQTDRLYGGASQGIGIAGYTFGDRRELGNPVLFYLFQNARIARFSPRLSLNYEWNLGLSFGWKPFDYEKNPYNTTIGSKINAYIDAGFYLNWVLSRRIGLTAGFDLTHFSNGNTGFPNGGLNTAGIKAGLVYDLGPQRFLENVPATQIGRAEPSAPSSEVPGFFRRIAYDLTFFGSWRKKGLVFYDEKLASPHTYTVLGFSFSPMYRIHRKFRAGIALDAYYDGSANVYTQDYIVGTQPEFFKPEFRRQLALGLSARAEYVMPYFTIGFGAGANILHGGGDLDAFYQILYLKTEITRNSYLHIGYSLQDFHIPNFLMLGIGFRFHHKTPGCNR